MVLKLNILMSCQVKQRGIITESPESSSPIPDPIILDPEILDESFKDRFDFPDFAEIRDRLDLVDFPDPDLTDPPDLLKAHTFSYF